MADTYMVVTVYKDGTKRSLETSDGKRAMSEASGMCYSEEQSKKVTLTKNGTSIFSESVKSYKEMDAERKAQEAMPA